MARSFTRQEIKALTYIGGGVASTWFLFEVFLRIDPFSAVCFKTFVWLGIAIIAAAASGAVDRFLWKASPFASETTARWVLRGCAAIALFVLVGGLFFVLVVGESCPDEMPRHWWMGAVAFAIGAGWLHLLRKALVTPRTGQPEEAPEADVPLLIAAAVVGLFVTAVSLGRSQDIRTADVAQEELRQAGFAFSMSSVQDAIYLLSPRSLKLFRLAKVDRRDVILALAAPTRLNPDEPLAQAVMRRISPDYADCSANPGDDVCPRIEAFLDLLEREEGGSNETFCNNVRSEPLELQEAIHDHAPPRPLLSHALSGGHGAVAQKLIEACGGLDPLGEIRPVHAAEAGAGAGPSEDLPASQSHLRAVLDPHLAVADGLRAGDGRWQEEEAVRTRRTLCDKGLQPTGWFARSDHAPPPDGCGASTRVEAALPAEGWSVEHGGETCRIDRFDLSFDGAIALRDVDHAKVGWSVSGRLGRDADTAEIVLQRDERDGRTRLVTETPREGAPALLEAFGWTADAKHSDSSPLWWADGPFRSWRFLRTAHPDDPAPLHLEDESAKDESAKGGSAKGEPAMGETAKDETAKPEITVRTAEWPSPAAGRWLSEATLQIEQTHFVTLSGEAAEDGCLFIGGEEVKEGFPLQRDEPFSRSLRLPAGRYSLRLGLAQPVSTPMAPIAIKADLRIPCGFGVTPSAHPLAVSSAFVDEIVPTGDQIAYAFDLEEEAMMTIVVGAEQDVVLDLKDEEDRFLVSGHDVVGTGVSGQPAVERLRRIAAPGCRVLVVRPFTPPFESKPVTLSVRTEVPRDLALDGGPVEVSEPLASGARAFYRLDVPDGARVAVALDGLAADLDLFVRKDGLDVDSSTNGGAEGERVEFSGSGRYEVEVLSFEASTYSLSASRAPEPPALPLDGPPVEATEPLASGARAFYRLDVPDGARVAVALDGLAADLDLFVRKDGLDVDSSTNGGAEGERVEFSGSGRYEVEVLSFEESPYRLSAERLTD